MDCFVEIFDVSSLIDGVVIKKIARYKSGLTIIYEDLALLLSYCNDLRRFF